MKLKTIALVLACLTAGSFFPSSVFAARVLVSDAELDTIAGAANSVDISGISNSTVSGFNANGNIQVGFYQWDDNHGNDSSVNKGANVQSGDSSRVQQNAASMANALAWGTVAQSITINTAQVNGDQKTESWAVMFIGGF